MAHRHHLIAIIVTLATFRVVLDTAIIDADHLTHSPVKRKRKSKRLVAL